jgi:ATP-dependent Clp protease ATP-binding subunit ClpA
LAVERGYADRVRFTERAQRVVLISQEESKRLRHDYVGTEHMLLALIALGEGVGCQALAELSIDLRHVRALIEKSVGTGSSDKALVEIPFTMAAKKVLEYAVEEAQNMQVEASYAFSYVGTEHLLLGMIREEKGGAAQVLEKLGLRLEAVREKILNILGPLDAKKGRSKLNPDASIDAQLQEIALLSEVVSVLITKKPHPTLRGRTMALIVLNDGVDLDEFYGRLSSVATEKAMSLLEYKRAGRKPVRKGDGRWIEDESFGDTLTL